VSAPVAVRTYPSRIEAEMALGLLQSAGLRAWVVADDAGGAYPFQLSGGAKLFVDGDDRAAAERLLDPGGEPG
jgi:hypothetical protein